MWYAPEKVLIFFFFFEKTKQGFVLILEVFCLAPGRGVYGHLDRHLVAFKDFRCADLLLPPGYDLLLFSQRPFQLSEHAFVFTVLTQILVAFMFKQVVAVLVIVLSDFVFVAVIAIRTRMCCAALSLVEC